MVPKTKDWRVLSLVCWSINARLSAKTSNDWGHRLIAALFFLLFVFYFVSFKNFFVFVCWNKQMDKQKSFPISLKENLAGSFTNRSTNLTSQNSPQWALRKFALAHKYLFLIFILHSCFLFLFWCQWSKSGDVHKWYFSIGQPTES